MLNSLKELSEKLPELNFYSGNVSQVIQELASKEKIEAVFFNRDYSPYSLKRDLEIKKLAKSKDFDCLSFADVLLNEPGQVLKKDKKPYTVFSYFYKTAIKNEVKKVSRLKKASFLKLKKTDLSLFSSKILNKKDYNTNLLSKGGRIEALKVLKNIKSIKNYTDIRDFPSIKGTSILSPHLKFGTVSVREVYFKIYKELGSNHPLIRQLYWRDFFSHISYFFPHVYKSNFYKKYDTVKWKKNTKLFNAWKIGKTGFPIVDAGMRELNTTGFMHNRVRMVVASFLTKDLHINWKEGERYFAQKLVDYDIAVNNGNWQWAASTGCDAQPYFRIFNPWLQQKRFDKDCLYIKKWIPELNDLTNKEIHHLFENDVKVKDYPQPVVNHKIEKEVALELYKIGFSKIV